eukprot:Lankesteria_metandrocarpae@DN8481_c0_g1_i1.p1
MDRTGEKWVGCQFAKAFEWNTCGEGFGLLKDSAFAPPIQSWQSAYKMRQAFGWQYPRVPPKGLRLLIDYRMNPPCDGSKDLVSMVIGNRSMKENLILINTFSTSMLAAGAHAIWICIKTRDNIQNSVLKPWQLKYPLFEFELLLHILTKPCSVKVHLVGYTRILLGQHSCDGINGESI